MSREYIRNIVLFFLACLPVMAAGQTSISIGGTGSGGSPSDTLTIYTGDDTLTTNRNIHGGSFILNLGTSGSPLNDLRVNSTNGILIGGTTRLGGALEVPVRDVTVSGTTVISNTDYYIRIDATFGAQTFVLPTATLGRVLIFKRIDNNPATVITFTGTVDTIVNPTSIGGGILSSITTQFGTVTLIANGTNWDKI